MKKIYTLLCIAATMLAACAKENLVENDATPQDEEVKYIDVTFDAEFPVPAELQDNAKTMLDEDLSVLWCDGDQIAVNNDKKKEEKTIFTAAVNPEDHHKAVFSGKINEDATKFIAVYPSNNVELVSTLLEGSIYTVLPNSQTATVGSFTNGCALSYACGSVSGGIIQDKIEFYNLCAILEFTMPEYVEGAQTVNIKSNDGTQMSGGCVIDRKNFDVNSFKASDKKQPTYDNVTVTAPNTASKFYAVIFPVYYSNGFTITVTTAGGQTYSRNVTKALDAKPNHIYNLGTLGVVLDKGKVDLAVNIEQNIKTGSVATFNIAANGDFKTMVKSWDINLYNSADQLVRKIEGNTTGSGTLETVGDFKLLAAGNYHAEVSYCMQTGSKREGLSFTGFEAPQFTVEGVVINATPTLNYEGNTLNGTDVELSFNTSAVDPDLAKLIHWTDIRLTAGPPTTTGGETYRTATAAGKMTPAEGKPYLPKGTYTLTAYFTLPELGSTKPTPLDPKAIEVNLTPTFGVELTSAKTSYDYYKENNIQKANTINKFAICELGASITGISNNVAAQINQDMPGAFTYEWFFEGTSLGKTENADMTVSGGDRNTDGKITVDFGSKKVSCTATFEGGSANGTKDVAITGLPYSIRTETAQPSGWATSGTVQANKENYMIFGNSKAGTTVSTYAISPKFFIPATVNTTCNVIGYVYCSSADKRKIGVDLYITVSNIDAKSGVFVGNFQGDEGNIPSVATFKDHKAELSFTTSSSVCVHADVRRDNTTLVWFAYAPGMITKTISIEYRK